MTIIGAGCMTQYRVTACPNDFKEITSKALSLEINEIKFGYLLTYSYLCTQIHQSINKLWTITRRIITICKGGGWRARQLIPLPLKPFHERKKD